MLLIPPFRLYYMALVPLHEIPSIICRMSLQSVWPFCSLNILSFLCLPLHAKAWMWPLYCLLDTSRGYSWFKLIVNKIEFNAWEEKNPWQSLAVNERNDEWKQWQEINVVILPWAAKYRKDSHLCCLYKSCKYRHFRNRPFPRRPSVLPDTKRVYM